ncbi:MAG: DUF1328 family protein [Nanoarchaeota archaeon]|nr:DUF1328 family protein [Nanoarchaeota archaeon]
MLFWSIIFLAVALLAAILGFGFLAGAAATIAKWLFIIFIIIFIISIIRSLL